MIVDNGMLEKKWKKEGGVPSSFRGEQSVISATSVGPNSHGIVLSAESIGDFNSPALGQGMMKFLFYFSMAVNNLQQRRKRCAQTMYIRVE